MKIKSQKDFWSGLMFVVIGLAFAWGATQYSFGPACPAGDPCAASFLARFEQVSARPGPGYFPFGLGLLMAALGGIVLFKALAIETVDGEPIGRWALRPLLVIVASVGLFGFTLPRLGLALALPILVVMASLAGDEIHWKDVLASCVVLTVGSWLVFIVGLKLVIPLWPRFITG